VDSGGDAKLGAAVTSYRSKLRATQEAQLANAIRAKHAFRARKWTTAGKLSKHAALPHALSRCKWSSQDCC